jgi:hypothetical protein
VPVVREGASVTDPSVRKDGLCAVCGKPRNPERSKKYAYGQALADPFCSNACCRKHHGLPAVEDIRPRYTGVAQTRVASGFQHGVAGSYRVCACEPCKAAVRGAE